MNKTDTAVAVRVSRNTLFGNLGLSAGKLIVGLLAHSGALVSDAVHSLSDVLPPSSSSSASGWPERRRTGSIPTATSGWSAYAASFFPSFC